jgi:hypothetical protein
VPSSGENRFTRTWPCSRFFRNIPLGLEYMLLDEALGAGLVEVTEVDNQGAVPNLKVHNKSPKMVLILDGEELVGAKQNRIVNTTILVAGNATVVIPVSCVEQGRWAYKTSQFYSEERMMPSRMRAMKAQQVQESVKAQGDSGPTSRPSGTTLPKGLRGETRLRPTWPWRAFTRRTCPLFRNT